MSTKAYMIHQKTYSTLLKFWTLFIGIGAVWGAVMMWIDPTGQLWGMDPLLPILQATMPMPEIFFQNFVFSGFVLLAVNGITQLTAAYLLFRRHHWAEIASAICGIILMLWIILEWIVFDFNALSNIYFGFGLIEIITAILALKKQNTYKK